MLKGSSHLRLLLWLGTLIALVQPGSAHSPYFSRSAEISLPDGSRGQLRLLHGDGIMASDPVRLVLLDPSGRLLARSEKVRSLDIVCRRLKTSCWGYDRDTLEILKPVSSEFRHGGPSYQQAGSLTDGDPIWALEGDSESWDFVRRPAPVREILSALVQERPAALVGTAVFAALCFLAFLLRLPKRQDRRSTRSKVIALVILASQTLLGMLALGVALLNAALLETSLPALGIGGFSGFLLARGLRRLLKTLRVERPLAG